jgi:hypothetical protein
LNIAESSPKMSGSGEFHRTDCFFFHGFRSEETDNDLMWTLIEWSPRMSARAYTVLLQLHCLRLS